MLTFFAAITPLNNMHVSCTAAKRMKATQQVHTCLLAVYDTLMLCLIAGLSKTTHANSPSGKGVLLITACMSSCAGS